MDAPPAYVPTEEDARLIEWMIGEAPSWWTTKDRWEELRALAARMRGGR